jgi:hypothetical protein
MKYTPKAFELLGYTYRGTKRQDFIGNVMPLWYKIDGSSGSFAWFSNQFHKNQLGSVHNGAILSLVDHAVLETIFAEYKRYPAAGHLDIKFTHTARIPRWIFATVNFTTINGLEFEVEGKVNANEPLGLPLLKISGQYTLPELPKILDEGK